MEEEGLHAAGRTWELEGVRDWLQGIFYGMSQVTGDGANRKCSKMKAMSDV